MTHYVKSSVKENWRHATQRREWSDESGPWKDVHSPGHPRTRPWSSCVEMILLLHRKLGQHTFKAVLSSGAVPLLNSNDKSLFICIHLFIYLYSFIYLFVFLYLFIYFRHFSLPDSATKFIYPLGIIFTESLSLTGKHVGLMFNCISVTMEAALAEIYSRENSSSPVGR